MGLFKSLVDGRVRRKTLVTGSSVAACEKATSVNDAGKGLEATSAANIRL